jgi:predicted transcriptional regulator
MKIKDIVELLQATHLTPHMPDDNNFQFAFASDLMSDVLTLQNNNVLLITGLNNVQALRTAYMSDIHCVIIARNKTVTNEMLNLANELQIHIIQSAYTVFRISGILYSNDLKPIY